MQRDSGSHIKVVEGAFGGNLKPLSRDLRFQQLPEQARILKRGPDRLFAGRRERIAAERCRHGFRVGAETKLQMADHRRRIIPSGHQPEAFAALLRQDASRPAFENQVEVLPLTRLETFAAAFERPLSFQKLLYPVQ